MGWLGSRLAIRSCGGPNSWLVIVYQIRLLCHPQCLNWMLAQHGRSGVFCKAGDVQRFVLHRKSQEHIQIDQNHCLFNVWMCMVRPLFIASSERDKQIENSLILHCQTTIYFQHRKGCANEKLLVHEKKIKPSYSTSTLTRDALQPPEFLACVHWYCVLTFARLCGKYEWANVVRCLPCSYNFEWTSRLSSFCTRTVKNLERPRKECPRKVQSESRQIGVFWCFADVLHPSIFRKH